MNARLLHVSDLHVGTHEEREVEQGLARLVERLEPQLVVASGDLAHRGRRVQLERAAELLRSLGPPVLAVPGNHDLPYTPARLVRPWAEFERIWETTEPTASSPGLHVIGLNSARPFRQQGGALSGAQLRRAAERLAAAEEGALRVDVLHHHLIGAPWSAARKRPVSRRNHV
ncbi:MAG TPA: metallophosphoesterase, partial [Gaiellaceae bacterium]